MSFGILHPLRNEPSQPISHNMDDDMPFPSHVTRRGAVYQYVRRIPDDIRDAFPSSRIQRSLRTRDPAEARALAARVAVEVEAQFALARRKKGVTLAVTPVDDWAWTDWRMLADWFTATLIEDDHRKSLARLTGKDLFRQAQSVGDPVRTHPDFVALTRLNARLEATSVADYAAERLGFVRSIIRRVGVPVVETSEHFERFMAACLAGELTFLDVAIRRRMGQKVSHRHPDEIAGRWRGETAAAKSEIEAKAATVLGTMTENGARVGKTLLDCHHAYVADHERAGKPVRKALADDKTAVISDFEDHSGVTDIGLVARRHIVEFRNHLADDGGYAPATVNKKMGHLTTMLETALKQGWLDTTIRGGIRLTVPEGSDDREPYSDEDLARIFSHPGFRTGDGFDAGEPLGALRFWLPVISCLHGMISSEILQLGPDTVAQHPEHDILCFVVTNAGGRRVKTAARKRWVPIRREILDLGFPDIVEAARAKGWRTLWAAVEERSATTEEVSQSFSPFWSTFSRDTIGIADPQKVLYSFRHAFKDRVTKAGASETELNQLMGHAERGTSKRYGTKRAPRPVDIVRLDRLVQGIDWAFLKTIGRDPYA